MNLTNLPSGGRRARIALSVLLGAVSLAACADDAPRGNVAALSVSGGGTGGSGGSGGADASGAGGANEGGAPGSGGRAGGGPVVSAGAGGTGAGGNAQAGNGAAGKGGTGSGGNGDAFPVGGPLYHVSCRTSLAGGEAKSAFRFAGKILTLPDGQRFVFLQPLATTATTVAETVGAVQKGESAGPAVDGDPVVFGDVTIPPAANPITSNTVVIADTSLRLVIAGPQSRPCAELEGRVKQPIDYDLTAPGSIDTCLFDPVTSPTTPVQPITDGAAFVICAP